MHQIRTITLALAVTLTGTGCAELIALEIGGAIIRAGIEVADKDDEAPKQDEAQ